MTLSFEQSFKKRLQTIAKERNLTPADVWQNVITERFLVRLCRSPYSSHFILKGGWLLSKHIPLGRETRDLDFTVERLSNEILVLQEILKEIVAIEIDDGFTFSSLSVVLLEHFHMQYSGAQAKLEVGFGKAKFPLFIDLGFGDFVNAKEDKISLLGNARGPLFEHDVNLKCYPIEFIFAEKLETIVYRGAENSRMKDFHDLYTLVSARQLLQQEPTHKIVQAVFHHRKTPLKLPIRFTEAALTSLQTYWSRYHRSITVHNVLPSEIQLVLKEINDWLS